MSEILIVLKLRRRSGVLASAVAALGRCGLEFRSQRLSDEDGPRLDLTAEGLLVDSAPVLNAYAEVRGVAEVLDVLVDGESLLHQAEPEQLPPLERGDAHDPGAEDAGQATDMPDAEIALEDEPGTALEHPPSPQAAASAPATLAGSGSDIAADTRLPDQSSSDTDSEDTEALDPEEEERRRRQRSMRMIMRRRRRYY